MVSLPALAALAAVQGSAVFAQRAKDWRIGAVVYQVFVDRFAPTADIESKKKIILPPRQLMPWSETPKASQFDPATGEYPHTIQFWGGDLNSLRGKLGYIQDMGADVLYLNPIFKAFSNHKYDTDDYMEIDPEYGAKADFLKLVDDVHARNMRLVLDGVFNHMGYRSPKFQSALHDPKSPYRDWFTFDKSLPNGYLGWVGIAGLPVLNLANPTVEDYLWAGRDSVVKSYLRDGIDGWRLDVAFDIGPRYLSGITHAAHEEKPGSLVVGEISGYPADWFDAVDGVFNFHSLALAEAMLRGEITGGRAGKMLDQVAKDAGLENLMRSWLLIDNHDTPRAADIIPDFQDRKLVELLQFTLPGSPVIYYGSELGMKGEGDPEDRAPMRWDLANANNLEWNWMRQMVKLRKTHPALKYGDFKVLESDQLLAFARTTDKVGDTVIVVVNPTDREVIEMMPTRVGRLMSWGELDDVLTGTSTRSIEGLMRLVVKPRTAMVLVPNIAKSNGYSPYDRIP